MEAPTFKARYWLWLKRKTRYRKVLLGLGLAWIAFQAYDTSKVGAWSDAARDDVENHCKAAAPFDGWHYDQEVCPCLVKKMEAEYSPGEANQQLTPEKVKALGATCWQEAFHSAAIETGGRWSPEQRSVMLNRLSSELGEAVGSCVVTDLEKQMDFQELKTLRDEEWVSRLKACRQAHPYVSPEVPPPSTPAPSPSSAQPSPTTPGP